MILVGTASDSRVQIGRVDNRLVGLQDIMPTLLTLSGLPVPETCEGKSMVSDERREFLYGEALLGPKAMRMVHDGRHKLIWYPAGSRFQLFDLVVDPREMVDRSDDSSYGDVLSILKRRLREFVDANSKARWFPRAYLTELPFARGRPEKARSRATRLDVQLQSPSGGGPHRTHGRRTHAC